MDRMWECECTECGAVTFTDQWLGDAPYFNTNSCHECGLGIDTSQWCESNEPHPSVWS